MRLRLLCFASVVAVLTVLAVTGSVAPASAQAPLVTGLGGVEGFGTSCMTPNDDGNSVRIDLTPAFPAGIRFFAGTHTNMYVNTNGNITFSGPEPTYTPMAFPVADRPMIAPYWADVDIREGRTCTIFTDGAGDGTGACPNPRDNGVWWFLEPGRVVVTWDNVGYYRCHSDRDMAFQLILTAAPGCGGAGDFDVEFRYNRCEWTTGDASGGSGGLGGTAAQAGFDAGDSRNFVEIMGSRTGSIHTILCTMSNVGEVGVWRFQIRSGTVICPDAGDPCDTGMLGVCAAGRTNCVGGGTACMQEVTPSAERCNALDDDCDGMTDEDDGICAERQICSRGTCIDHCFEGGCGAGEVCNPEGRCVDAACVDVVCADDERCEMGMCIGACDGVTCPPPLSCSGGRCVDLCASTTCDDCTVCEGGTCVPRCTFVMCPSGQACASDGHCVDSGCESATCEPGFVCRGGSCVDACAGATCPRGEMCVAGACVPVVEGDAGPPPPRPDTGPYPDASLLYDAGPRSDGSAGLDAGRSGGGRGMGSEAGCACHVPSSPIAGGTRLYFGLALALTIAVALRRRRR